MMSSARFLRGRIYLETQARLWPELAGTPAVPTVTDAVVEAMADDFERRFRTHSVDVFNPAGLPESPLERRGKRACARETHALADVGERDG
jgi:hypothetical protein